MRPAAKASTGPRPFLHLRRMVTWLSAGASITVLVAWICLLWAPARSTFDPFDHPSQAIEKVDPDGEKGLYYEETGHGWEYAFFRGDGGENGGYFWKPPYGGTYHRVAGWPFHAMRSRVEVLDSQISGRTNEGLEASGYVPPWVAQRTRWALPWTEIIYRGLASKDLPAWLHAQPNRRLPLIPMPRGFAEDTVVFAVLGLLSEWGARLLRRRTGQLNFGRSERTADWRDEDRQRKPDRNHSGKCNSAGTSP